MSRACRPSTRRPVDLVAAVARQYKATVIPFDPECIHAGILSERDGLLRCRQYGHDPVLRSDCLGCPAWEPPGEEQP